MNTIACPKCGKTLTISDPSRAVVFCEYCGTKINFNVNVNLTESEVIDVLIRTDVERSDDHLLSAHRL